MVQKGTKKKRTMMKGHKTSTRKVQDHEIRTRALELRRQGVPYRAICKQLGIGSPSTIKRWEKKVVTELVEQDRDNVRVVLKQQMDNVSRLKNAVMDLLDLYLKEKERIEKEPDQFVRDLLLASQRKYGKDIKNPKTVSQGLTEKKVHILEFLNRNLKEIIIQNDHVVSQYVKLLAAYDPTKYSPKEVQHIFMQLGVLFANYLPDNMREKFETEMEDMIDV